MPSSPTARGHHVPVVPRRDQVQEGYALDLRTLSVRGAEVRLFTVPGRAVDPQEAMVCLPGMGASGRSFAPLARVPSLLLWSPPLRTPRGVTPLEHNLRLLADGGGVLPPRFFLLGSSYGSLIALAFTLRYPERVRALILVSPVASSRRIRRAGFVASTFLRVPLPFAYLFAPAVARILGGRALPAEGRAEIIREARRISPRELGRRLMDVLSVDLLPQLARLRVPTLVIHGKRDRVVPLSAASEVAARIRAAELVVVEGAAHLPYMSHADETVQAIERFLAPVRAGAGEPRP